MTWIKKWEVDGSNGHTWVVSLSDTGEYGCSCPVWKFRRVECHHIQQIKFDYGFEKKPYTENEQQLLSIIKRCFSGLISGRKIFKIKLPDGFTVGINNVGIGRVEKSNLEFDDTKSVYRINDLETYLKILSNRRIVNQIKKSVYKEEKKLMLDVLYNYLKDWDGAGKRKQEKILSNLFNDVNPYIMVDVL